MVGSDIFDLQRRLSGQKAGGLIVAGRYSPVIFKIEDANSGLQPSQT
jgi:hypothetical protein